MFSVPYTFANEDESYITIPALKRFAREKKNEDPYMRSRTHRRFDGESAQIHH